MACIIHVSVKKNDILLFCPSQGAMPDIIGNTKEEFFSSKLEMVRKCAEICYEELMKIPCITCPCKPEGSMFTMVINPQGIRLLISQPQVQA